MSDSPRVESKAKAATRRPLFRATSIFAREVRASAGAATAMAFLQLVIVLAPTVFSAISRSVWRFDFGHFVATMTGCGVVLGLMLGVICGAEEQENGTADFALRLPIPRQRILAEKIAGSAAAFGLWLVLSLALDTVVAQVCGRFLWIESEGAWAAAFKNSYTANAVGWLALLYTTGLAAGAWIGKAIPAAIVAGGASVLYTVLGLRLLGASSGWETAMRSHWTPPMFWLGCLMALFVAAMWFRTKEGT